jgi:outer membrane protein assembly factor BamE (lipoprotein component of BamABCDE complex)
MRLLITAVLIALATPGCSIYKAATAPPPVAVDNIKVGSTRAEALAVFGMPKTTDFAQPNDRTDVYEFVDGNHSASKLRIIPYVGADVFTLGLAELVLWPMEIALLQGSEGRAVVTFDQDNRVKTVMVTKRDGTPWKSREEAPSPSREHAAY